ncbi:hypothetical protein ACOME3_009581 [Neoechinorhynchus agilis]
MAVAPLSAAIKTESGEQSNLEHRLLQVCTRHKQVNQKILIDEFPGVSTMELCRILNRLSKSKVIEIVRVDKELWYRLKDQDTLKACASLNEEETSIYELIKDAKTKGITNMTIREKSGISLQVISKCLRQLLDKNLIAAFSTSSQAKRKVYVLASLKPDESSVGGIFYTDVGVDVEFVSKIKDIILSYIERKRSKELTTGKELIKNISVSVNELLKLMSSKAGGGSEFSIKREDIVKVLEGLVFEGKLIKCKPISTTSELMPIKRMRCEQDDQMYKLVNPCVGVTTAVLVPCTLCPNLNRCRTSSGIINPSLCTHMFDFTDF